GRRAQAAGRARRGAADDAPRTARPRRDLPARGLSGSHEDEPPMTAPRPFRKELEAAVNARHSRLTPFTEKWVKGELSRAQLGAWAAQHYQYVSQFPRWCATVYGECPDPDARDFLLENIIEEESGTKHVDLLIRFAEACGVSRAEDRKSTRLNSSHDQIS